MDGGLVALIVFVVIAIVAAVGSVRLGIVTAPRIGRMLDRAESDHEESRDRPD